LELAGCDGIDCRHVGDGESWPAGVSGVWRVVGEDVGIALSDKNIGSAGVGSERDSRLVHGKYAVVSCCVGVGVGVWVGVRVGVGVGVRVEVWSDVYVVAWWADESAGRVSSTCCQVEE
jgi:hypothetical protein